MSIVLSTIDTYKKVKDFLSNTTLHKVVFLVFGVFLTLNIMNVWAQEEIEPYKIDIVENFNQADISGTATTGDEEKNVDKTTEFQTLGGLHTVTKALCGVETCFEVKDEEAFSQMSPIMRHGFLGVASSNMNALLYNPPTVDVVGHLAQEWVPGYDYSNRALAAESGYDYLMSLNITPLWNTVRTIAYTLFVLILIIAGFLIMFRRKIGGQLAITVFNTLPNVVVGLIMATFSFAIVGIFIDIGALLVRILASILVEGNENLVSVNNPFSLLGVIFGQGLNKDILASVGVTSIVSLLTGAIVALATGGIGALIIGGVVAVGIMLFVVAIVGYGSIKVWFTLFKAYLGLLLDTIISPLIWAFASIPGNSKMSGEWMRRVAKNILTFPLVFFLVNIGFYFVTMDIPLGFPAGLSGGDVSALEAGQGAAGWLIKLSLPIIMLYVAAEAPKFLEDILPSGGGPNAGKAMENVGKSLSKFIGG